MSDEVTTAHLLERIIALEKRLADSLEPVVNEHDDRLDVAGLDCPLLDGGSFGDRNVMPRSQMLDPARCELVGAGVVYAGSDPESEL